MPLPTTTLETRSQSAEVPSPTTRKNARLVAVIEVLLIWGIFSLHAGWPIPDVNESHYLVKAKHFWNPAWIPSDFFLDPPAGMSRLVEGHLLFYLGVGWWSRFLSRYWFAWLGRAATWLLMAWAWRRLSVALIPTRWIAPVAAALFVCLNEHFQMAGEWVVGGFEAKSIAYALVLFGLEAMVRGRWMAACAWVGMATAMHVLVGGWTAVAFLAVWLRDREHPPSLKQLCWGGFILGVLALPGVLPALALDRGATTETIDTARFIYVYQRLPHHLLPEFFAHNATTRFALLFVAWLAITWQGAVSMPLVWLRSFVLFAVAICALGVVVSWFTWHLPVWEARLMRYYWFRLADFALPMGATFALLAAVLSGLKAENGNAVTKAAPARTLAGVFALVLIAGTYLVMHGNQVLQAGYSRADAPTKVADPASWRLAAEWARTNTPADARFLTPRTSQTFKWYAGRSEVANWKDLPQDALGTVEWWNRLVAIHGRDEFSTNSWSWESLSEISPRKLRALGKKYGANYVLTERTPEIDLPRVYMNHTYAIYRLD